MLRLFFVTSLVWILYKLKLKSVWLALSIVAFLFALAHLPLNDIASISLFMFVRQIFTSGLAGMVFGWLYWKKGLESAMLAHFSTDIVLVVIHPLFFVKEKPRLVLLAKSRLKRCLLGGSNFNLTES